MRQRDDQARFGSPQSRRSSTRLKRLGTAAEINQQNVLARNRSLDAENQHDPAIARVGLPPADVELRAA
jgi:hypothetical protein